MQQKIRINDLARELEVKSKVILDLLIKVGVTEKKTHSSSIEVDEAERVKKYYAEHGEPGSSSAARSSRAHADEFKPKIDLSHISKPGDVLKAITQKAAQPQVPPRSAPSAALPQRRHGRRWLLRRLCRRVRRAAWPSHRRRCQCCAGGSGRDRPSLRRASLRRSRWHVHRPPSSFLRNRQQRCHRPRPRRAVRRSRKQPSRPNLGPRSRFLSQLRRSKLPSLQLKLRQQRSQVSPLQPPAESAGQSAAAAPVAATAAPAAAKPATGTAPACAAAGD